MQRRREIAGNRMIGKKDFLRSLLGTLRANGTVGIFVDQNTHLDQGVFVDFFGIPARCGTSFAKLANHTGAAVVPGFAVWNESEGRYRLKFYPEVEMTGDVTADTARIHAAVEGAIREYPDQWLWVPPALESPSARGAGAIQLAGGGGRNPALTNGNKDCHFFQHPRACENQI